MTMKVKIVADVSIVAAFVTAIGTVAGSAALADDLAIAVYNGVNQLRHICGPIGDDPRLTAAAQRHANDMAMNGMGGGQHSGRKAHPRGRASQMRATPAPAPRVEIIYWGTGSLANANAALDWWMQSPPTQRQS